MVASLLLTVQHCFHQETKKHIWIDRPWNYDPGSHVFNADTGILHLRGDWLLNKIFLRLVEKDVTAYFAFYLVSLCAFASLFSYEIKKSKMHYEFLCFVHLIVFICNLTIQKLFKSRQLFTHEIEMFLSLKLPIKIL